MCGITGVVGQGAALKALALTLGQLNRGTQGSGVAWLNTKGIKLQKMPTHPVHHFIQVAKKLEGKGFAAIAHNRLPTQGGVVYENTHPFISCDRSFALVHNGNAWNKQKREELKKRGHFIFGETDSEVLCHELEELVKDGLSFPEALWRLMEEERFGACLVLTRQGKIFGIRDWSHPLHVAEANGEVYLASMAEAFEVLGVDKSKAKSVDPYDVIEVGFGGVKIHKAPKKLRRIGYTIDLRGFGYYTWIRDAQGRWVRVETKVKKAKKAKDARVVEEDLTDIPNPWLYWSYY